MITSSSKAEHPVIALTVENLKGELGRFNIKHYYKNNHFDKRSFQKHCRCVWCNHSFNPFYATSQPIKAEWAWGKDGKPEKRYAVQCTHCQRELRFTLFID
jgi:hypothetical protein